MSHLDEGTLHAMLDGELEPSDVAEIQAHLAACSSCGLRLREVREFLDEADRLIASVEMDGATAASMRRPAPIEAAPEMARLEPPGPEPARSEPAHEPVRAEPVRSEPTRAEPVHSEPPARPERPGRHEPPVHPEPPVRADAPAAAAPRRPEPPPRPAPRPVPDRPVGEETWNAPPPPLLMPDNESAADRRMRRVRKYGWAAMIAVFVGAGFVGSRFREPAKAAFDASLSRREAEAIVSPEETARPAAPTSDSTPAAFATRPPLAKEGGANAPARADASKNPPKEVRANAGKATEKVAEKDARDTAEEPEGSPADRGLALAQTPDSESEGEAAPSDTSAPVDEAGQDSSGTEDLATIRARASDALAELDRQRRRNEAAAATAALDAQRRRRTAAQPAGAVAPTVARAAQAPAPPPTPPTLEQRAQVYLRIGLDEASRQLGGPVHVIEGMSAMFMGLAQGVVVPGADATRPVVRVVYQDSQGRLILLDQQRLRPGQPVPQGSPLGWVMGETGVWLHGEVGPDALRTYRPRVR
jgi:hypothetical protein